FENWHTQFLSHDVIECNVDCTDRRHHDAAHPVVIEITVHAVPQLLDVPGALADDGVAQIADGRGDPLDPTEVRPLAPSHNPLSRLHSHKQPRCISANAREQIGIDFDNP